jgi:general nucleoside transport system ATP-binding protein
MRVELAHIDKRFGSLRANDDVSLTIEAGSIHGLLGENGAGKSTLIRILSGFLRPDAGQIRLDGRPAELFHPARAIEAGIGVLHQEPLDFPPLSVLETFLVARPGPLFLRRSAAEKELRSIAERFGFSVDPEEQVGRLTVGERQQLELLRLLSLGAKTLLLDEPTTGISIPQQQALFAALKRLRSEGRSIVLVSHKLADVEALCDRVTILRQGKVVGEATMPAKADHLVELMFGKTLALLEKPPTVADGEALELSSVAFGDHRLSIAIDRLAIRRGEVIGLAGLEGSGQRLLLQLAAGLLAPRRGRVAVGTADLTGQPYQAFRRAGVGYLPGDRAREGLIGGLSIEEHVALRAASPGLFLRPREIRRAALSAIDTFRIRGEATSRVEQLSGGNQQRTQLSLLPPSLCLLLMEHPTRGLDIESARWVWEQLIARCRTGTAILFASSDLDEVMRYSDRVMVFSGGRVSSPIDASLLDLDRLGKMIGGQVDDLALAAAELGA